MLMAFFTDPRYMTSCGFEPIENYYIMRHYRIISSTGEPYFTVHIKDTRPVIKHHVFAINVGEHVGPMA